MNTSTSILISAKGLGHRFGERKALDGIDFELGAGEIAALVGPNGSGKTTFLSCAAGFLRPSSGELRVGGFEPWRDRRRVMERARFAFAPPALFEGLTAREHLRYLGNISRKGRPRLRAGEIEEALERVGLSERADERVGAFSFGMRQRLALAQALTPRPELLVLDEPTDGLDPLAVLELRKILVRLREEFGLAVLLSSHLLIEVDLLVDHLLVLNEGRCLFKGQPHELSKGNRVTRLRASDTERAASVLLAAGWSTVPAGNGELQLAGTAHDLEQVRTKLNAAGIRLDGYWEQSLSFEQALLERLKAARRNSSCEADSSISVTMTAGPIAKDLEA